jgi:carboxyl-terminal processing protease
MFYNNKIKTRNNWFYLLLFTSFMIGGFTACEKDPVEPTETKDQVDLKIQEINVWIKDIMEALYFWNEKIPNGLNPVTSPDPKAFFNQMVYKTEDRWSFITPDFSALLAELDGVPLATGISPTFVLISDNKILLIVEFVFKGTPAEEAGLKRGDIILTIDGQELTLSNYSELYSKNSFVAGLGVLSGSTIVPYGTPITLNARVIEANPLIHHEILNIDGIKTGYLVYESFTSGVSDVYKNELTNLLADFKSANITELIVDLRYNRGGEISMAAFLASGIVPSEQLGNGVLIRYMYNAGLTDYLRSIARADSADFIMKFPPNPNNLNLSRVFFLNGWKTASASELINIGLRPYMQVISIGDTTVGKYTGSSVFYDTNVPPKHDWAMMPIVLKYANALGYTDFKDGLAPNYYVEENIVNLPPFGDVADNLLNQAKAIISGGVLAASMKKAQIPFDFSVLDEKEDWKKGILTVPFPIKDPGLIPQYK